MDFPRSPTRLICQSLLGQYATNLDPLPNLNLLSPGSYLSHDNKTDDIPHQPYNTDSNQPVTVHSSCEFEDEISGSPGPDTLCYVEGWQSSYISKSMVEVWWCGHAFHDICQELLWGNFRISWVAPLIVGISKQPAKALAVLVPLKILTAYIQPLSGATQDIRDFLHNNPWHRWYKRHPACDISSDFIQLDTGNMRYTQLWFTIALYTGQNYFHHLSCFLPFVSIDSN